MKARIFCLLVSTEIIDKLINMFPAEKYNSFLTWKKWWTWTPLKSGKNVMATSWHVTLQSGLDQCQQKKKNSPSTFEGLREYRSWKAHSKCRFQVKWDPLIVGSQFSSTHDAWIKKGTHELRLNLAKFMFKKGKARELELTFTVTGRTRFLLLFFKFLLPDY